MWRVPDGSVTLLGQPEDTGPVGRELGMGGGGGLGSRKGGTLSLNLSTYRQSNSTPVLCC